jgi:hypothetical protein
MSASTLLSKINFLDEGLRNTSSSSSKIHKNVSSYVKIEETKCYKARVVNINGDHKTGIYQCPPRDEVSSNGHSLARRRTAEAYMIQAVLK